MHFSLKKKSINNQAKSSLTLMDNIVLNLISSKPICKGTCLDILFLKIKFCHYYTRFYVIIYKLGFYFVNRKLTTE